MHHDVLSQIVVKKDADATQKKRAAFGDITNAFNEKAQQKKDLKKSQLPKKAVVSKKEENKVKDVTKAKDTSKVKRPQKKRQRKLSNSSHELELDDNVVQLSQGSVISSSQESSGSNLSSSQESLSSSDASSLNSTFTVSLDNDEETVPEGVDDVDKENLTDIAQVALYAPFIFRYYKEREVKFMVPMYMDRQASLTSNMRAILVDWLVEVQENFELNHETLYLAVKLVDTYLSKRSVSKERLQLIGAVALFIACKFDERCPPLIEDFLYICDDAYQRNEFLTMERFILRTVGFDIGMPLSYRFLRRFAKCARASMETLTMGRYILEMSLMEYEFIKYRESKIAAASLLLAFKMKKSGFWNETLEHYTGYTEEELIPVTKELNVVITSPPRQLTTIKSKYSHRVFYEVAKVQPLLLSALS